MDVMSILALVAKGVSMASSAISIGSEAATAVPRIIEAIKNITSKDPEKVTEEDMDKTEAELDSLLDEFNLPLEGE